MNELLDSLIVGAGMSGLVAARALMSRGMKLQVLDKGRGVGGRLATRWSETTTGKKAYFDHGAQFFTVRSESFAREVEVWLAQGKVREWCRGFSKGEEVSFHDGHSRYVAVGGMNALARHVAADLPVRVNSEVKAITWREHWDVLLASGERLSSRTLLLTAPVPQSLALLDAGGCVLPSSARSELNRIRYEPCFAVLAELEAPSQLPEPGALQLHGEPLRWLADNFRKGISPQAFSVTLHAGPEFTQQHWDTPHEEVARLLLQAAAPWLGTKVLKTQVHRWRYSQPVQTHAESCLWVEIPGRVVFAGDAFGQPRIEGAFLSGQAAAEKLASE